MNTTTKTRIKYIASELLDVGAVCGLFVVTYGTVLTLYLKWFVVPFYPVSVDPLIAGCVALGFRFLFAQHVAVDAGRSVVEVMYAVVVRAALGLVLGYIAHIFMQ
jgi:hypothetical protein